MAEYPYRERFLHVAFLWSGTPKIAELEPLFNTPNCWLLWTNNGPDVWYGAIASHMTRADNVVIAEIVFDHVPKTYQGWYNKGLWDWIDQRRDGGTYSPWDRSLKG